MLAELVDHVVGVDPDRDWITLAVLDVWNAGVVAEGRFPATRDGYDEAIEFVDGHSVDSERAWVIEGSAGYGRGLAVGSSATASGSSSSIDRPARRKTARSPTPWTPSAPPARCSAESGSASRELTRALGRRSAFMR